MKKLLLLLLFCAPLMGADKVGSQLNVDLTRTQRIDPQGRHIGFNYAVENKSKEAVQVKISLEQTENTLNGLVPGAVTVQPEETVPVGWVEQRDTSTASNWRLRWHVTEVKPAKASSS